MINIYCVYRLTDILLYWYNTRDCWYFVFVWFTVAYFQCGRGKQEGRPISRAEHFHHYYPWSRFILQN